MTTGAAPVERRSPGRPMLRPPAASAAHRRWPRCRWVRPRPRPPAPPGRRHRVTIMGVRKAPAIPAGDAGGVRQHHAGARRGAAGTERAIEGHAAQAAAWPLASTRGKAGGAQIGAAALDDTETASALAHRRCHGGCPAAAARRHCASSALRRRRPRRCAAPGMRGAVAPPSRDHAPRSGVPVR